MMRKLRYTYFNDNEKYQITLTEMKNRKSAEIDGMNTEVIK